MPLLLCRHLDKRTQWAVAVAEDDFTIGCSEAATIPVPDPGLAAKEVLISRKGERYLLQDVAEKGRVLLGGTVTRAGLLKDGDRFRAGRISILFFENIRTGSGQVELYRDDPPGTDEDFLGLDGSIAGPAQVLAGSPGARGDIPGSVRIGVLAVLLAAGFALGAIAIRGARAEKSSLVPRQARPVEEKRSATKPLAAKPLADALKQLTETLGRPAPPPPSPPGKYALGILPDATASTVALFRLFLDLAGRPPLRTEERELLPRDHEARWREVLEIARREATCADLGLPVEAQFDAWLGRKPSADEVREVNGLLEPARPAAFWIAALEEYRRADRRRPRSPLVRARSFIVDIVDRPPSSAAEVEAVRAALEAPGGVLEAARTLVHAPEARLAPADGPEGWWEEERFRFLLRAPVERERQEISRVLSGLEPMERRRWLHIALASLEEYGSY